MNSVDKMAKARAARKGKIIRDLPEQAQERIDQAPERYKASVIKAIRGQLGPKASIRVFCLECVGFSVDSIRNCSALACPLWMQRPFK
jgi:hypothetical protein